MEHFQRKRFKEAETYFRQVLFLEPRHTGAAYLLSLSLYFAGAFNEARHLFKQLLDPNSPLEAPQIEGLRELTRYADYECLRLEYWRGLKLTDRKNITKELKRLKWDLNSISGFHLYLENGLAADWMQKNRLDSSHPKMRITDRNNRMRIFSDCQDADMTIGPYLEVIQNSTYQFIPFRNIKVIEVGSLKRWIKSQVLYQDGSRDDVQIPLVYRNSMLDPAHGVQEGAETVLRSIEGMSDLQQAFGQKQYRSPDESIGLAEILMIEALG